ncbi:mannosyltransferase family protein [Curtobacterium sp. ISL-83]|uniref:mannosyltransferase family protein n=1 Tax=Curtobacterium sp. ISL-83 TaxID=2819145 RepID=UPI001BE71698|nr:mannosyltransferase family protein [Curtobacterium sp. ISL-83]MBT2501480.1 hypothetical protein [Curtobacterium sp. ISL-83]
MTARGDLLAPGGSWVRALLGGAAMWTASRILVTTIALVSQWAATGSLLGGRPFAELLARWDAGHFADIAARGYPLGSTDVAFFPGYPILGRGVAAVIRPVTSDAVPVAMMLVAGLGGLVAAVLLWRLTESTAGPRAAFLATLLFVVGPYAVFLHASYSESCFAAAAIGAWYCAVRERWWWAGIVTAVAGTFRANGLFLLAAIAVLYVTRRRAAGKPVVAWPALGVLIGVLGFAGYMLALWVQTGRLDAWSEAQQHGWGRVTSTPWTALADTVQAVLHHPLASARPQFLLDIVFAVLLLVAVGYFVARRRWAEAVLLGLTLVSLTTSSTYVSLARNTLTLFPIWIALAAGAQRHAVGRWIVTGVLVVGVVLLTANTHQFTLGAWAD